MTKGKWTILAVLLFALSIIMFYLFVSPLSNNPSATIEKYNDQYTVTVIGKRLLMAHDPVSFLKRGTYQDTFKITIPRSQGVISGEEIAAQPGHYKMLGTITLENERLILDLHYNDGAKDPLSWNGEYKLNRYQ
jgi:hypothetical protein